jgi:hypothetical protein
MEAALSSETLETQTGFLLYLDQNNVETYITYIPILYTAEEGKLPTRNVLNLLS